MYVYVYYMRARGQCLLARGISSTREVSRTRGTRRDEEPPRCPSYGTLFFTHRQRHGDARISVLELGEKRVVLGSTRPSSPPHAEERESGHASPYIGS